jgi:hypothetical protein
MPENGATTRCRQYDITFLFSLDRIVIAMSISSPLTCSLAFAEALAQAGRMTPAGEWETTKVRVIFPRRAALLSAAEHSVISFKRCLTLRNGSNLLIEQCNANGLLLTESVAWCQYHLSGEFDCLYLGRFVHSNLLITRALPLSG